MNHNLIAQRREYLKLSQAKVAAAAATTQSTVSRLERGERDTRLSTMVEVARALGIELRLIPRELVPAVDNLLHGTIVDPAEANYERPLYALDEADNGDL